jgi:serine/threonine-protein kinase
VLPEDLLIIPVEELPDDVRQRLGEGEEDFAVTRPLARQPSKLIDGAAARLLEQFRVPKTIVQAVISYSRGSRNDPERVLEESLPLLRQFLLSGLLLPEGNAEARRIEASFRKGALIGQFRVIRCVQVLDDSELYQARDGQNRFVALKIARDGRFASMQQRIDHEIAALRRLAGAVGPELVDHGAHSSRPFLATTWVSGIDVAAAAVDLRQEGAREELLDLFTQIARAYAVLHARGVTHGDVHPGNLLVGRDGRITLIDFGLAHTVGLSSDDALRGGISFFMEPEYAREILNRQKSPPPTLQGEQFAVGALFYLLATGQHYMDFTLQQQEMLEQISAAVPLPFVDRGVEPWPELEAVLCRALASRPQERYPEMTNFAEALKGVARPKTPASIAHRYHADLLLHEVLTHVGIEGDLYRAGISRAPVSSVNFGGAGIAYALYRLACLRDDPHLLAEADAWIMKTEADAKSDAAFFNAAMDLTEATVGRVSIYHALPGVHLVKAIIAAANGESVARATAAAAFLEAIQPRCLERDLCLGRTGTVLGCALLLETFPNRDDTLRGDVRRCGEQRLVQLWNEAAQFEHMDGGRDWPNLGIAHGWAGLLYVTLCWHAVHGTAVPTEVRERLDQLVESARPDGRGVIWPWRQAPNDDQQASMPGWCNGSAGMVHLACLAHQLLGDDALIQMAEGAAWNTWEAGDGPVDLCCGYAGRAYALLELYRHTNEPSWLARAHMLAERAIAIAPQFRTADHPRHSLYKGELGLALLLADLEQPKTAVMPIFGLETSASRVGRPG